MTRALLPGTFVYQVFNLGLLGMYYGTFLDIDQEFFNSRWELTQAGLMPAFGLHTFIWTILFTTMHH